MSYCCLVLSRLAKLLMTLTLACSIGLHWALLQSLAWVGMVVSYSQKASLAEAVTKTFDGKHPCALCKAIAKGKKSEKNSDSTPAKQKLQFAHARAVFVFSAPTHFWKVAPLVQRADSRDHGPPTPPPKTVLG
jgi:hypothetical protein